jgi:hypothetical protein
LEDWTQQLVQQPADGVDIMTWWQKELANLPKKTRRIKAAMMIYGAWNIWKERNRRVFEQKLLSPMDVLNEVKAEVTSRKLACGGSEFSVS